MITAINDFIDWVGKRTLPTLILLSALSVSGSAAFYSVSGLSKLFAGASFEVIIMAGSLEIAKLVTATLLHQYWSTLNKLLKYYLTLAVVVLMVITSMGIYGFLSAAYQDTFNQLMKRDNQIAFLQEKVDFYQADVTRYERELQQISDNIATLSNAKATSIQVRDTSVAGGVRQTISTAELRLSQNRIRTEEANRKEIRAKRDQVADSLQRYQLNILELKSDTDVAGELGPLEYLSGLTGIGMDRIINWLLIVIVFVFDPLAVSLVIAANFAFAQILPPKTKRETEDIEEEEEVVESDPQMTREEYEERLLDSIKELEGDQMYPDELMAEMEERQRLYEIYGEKHEDENPRDIEVDYEKVEGSAWEIVGEEPVDFEDAKSNIVEGKEDIQKRIRDLETYLSKEKIGGINPKLKKNIENEIKLLKEKLQQEDDEDGLTKTY